MCSQHKLPSTAPSLGHASLSATTDRASGEPLWFAAHFHRASGAVPFTVSLHSVPFIAVLCAMSLTALLRAANLVRHSLTATPATPPAVPSFLTIATAAAATVKQAKRRKIKTLYRLVQNLLLALTAQQELNCGSLNRKKHINACCNI